MVSNYTPKHPHLKHSKVGDPRFYYMLIHFGLLGYTAKQMSQATEKPVQTVLKNFKKLRKIIAESENYRTEVFNLFYHVDLKTGDCYGKWRDEIKPYQTLETEEDRDNFEALTSCLTQCPLSNSPKQFMKEDAETRGYLNDTFPESYIAREIPMFLPLLVDIDRYRAQMEKKKTCRACRLCKEDKYRIIDNFIQSPYTYIDIMFHLSHFQVKELEDYYDHLYFAWASGILRGILHQKANNTALKDYPEHVATEIRREIVIKFVDMTYEVIAGHMLPSSDFTPND